jgi:hypothetical protein
MEEQRVEEFLDKVVSYAVLIPTVVLILFMFLHSTIGVLIFSREILSMFYSGEIVNFHSQAIMWLEVVATIVILVKAYKVLMAYFKNHHLSVKYLMEITFTASLLELLFNSASYELEMQIIFLILGLSTLLLYLVFYQKVIMAKEKEK